MNDNDEKNDIEDIEIVLGDASNLEISDVEDFMTDLKPTKEKKKDVVIPGAKKKKEENSEESKK